MKKGFEENGAPKGSGEERFRFEEANAKTGLPERTAEAQKRAAKRAKEGGQTSGEIDLTPELELSALGVHDAEEMKRIRAEIKELPDGGLEETA